MGKKRAKEHYDFIKEQYYKEIDNSIANTTIHACKSIEARIPQYQNNYSVIPEDSVSCLFSLENKDNVAVLNFASYKKPGGLYFQGVESQEESLCLESTLLPVIEAFKPTYYKHLNRGIYLNRALYSKDILFERERQKVYTYAGVAEYVCGVGDKELREAMLDRINFMLSIAEEHGVQTLMGCGIYGSIIFQMPFLDYLNITTWFLIGYFRNPKTKMVFEILMAWENEFMKIFTLFPEIHAPVLSHFITLKHYS